MRQRPGAHIFPYTTLFRSRGQMKYIVAFLFAGALATGCDESAGIREKSAEPKKSASANSAEKSSDQLTTIQWIDRKSTRLNSSHLVISYAVFCLKNKNKEN